MIDIERVGRTQPFTKGSITVSELHKLLEENFKRFRQAAEEQKAFYNSEKAKLEVIRRILSK